MEEFNTIEDVAEAIKYKFNKPAKKKNKKKILALYAFNSTGKTRMTNIMNESEIDGEMENESSGYKLKVLCYNAFLEDMFKWNNEDYILSFDPNSWIIRLVIDQGLEKDIIDSFNNIINSKVEPSFNFIQGEVTFNFVSGDDNSQTNIKISKGEESALIWSIFYAVLKTAIDSINTSEDNRTTTAFDDLEYIIIDDPVSSIDDTKIITIAINLIESIQSYQNNIVKFFITTHHALFYNVLVNSFRKDRNCNFEPLSLLKDNYILKLSTSDDSPFSYHLLVKDIIQKAIESNSVKKYHFNLFRNLLEKTANFLGYKQWYDCIFLEDNKDKFVRILNLYSHSKLSELESRELSSEDKSLFQEVFTNFIENFKWC